MVFLSGGQEDDRLSLFRLNLMFPAKPYPAAEYLPVLNDALSGWFAADAIVLLPEN